MLTVATKAQKKTFDMQGSKKTISITDYKNQPSKNSSVFITKDSMSTNASKTQKNKCRICKTETNKIENFDLHLPKVDYFEPIISEEEIGNGIKIRLFAFDF